MKRFFSFLVVSILLFTSFANISHAEISFPDVSIEAPFYDALNTLSGQGIIQGREDGLFHPELFITRAEALKIIFQLKGIPVPNELPENNDFSDVTNDKWYAPYIYMAKRKNTIQGKDDGLFYPNANITRAEALKIVLESFGVRSPTLPKEYHTSFNYPDVKEDSWYAPYVGFVAFNGIFKPENSFLPDDYMNRGEFVLFTNNVNLLYVSKEIKKMRSGEVLNKEKGEEQELESQEQDLYPLIPDEYEDKWDRIKEGVASYYGNSFTGRNTSSGTIFDNSLNIGASPLLPFHTIVKVTNPTNEKSVEVEILDCGPFAKGRVIDLSQNAFQEISSLSAGLVFIKMEIIKLGEGSFQDKCYEIMEEKW